MKLQKISLGEFSILLACVFFTGTTLLVKYASMWCSGNVISFIRFGVGGSVAFLLILIFEKRFAVHDRGAWLIRGVLGGITMSATYLGIQMTTSGKAILLVNTYPIFAVMFGLLFFGEKAALNNLLGLVVCMIGIFFVFQDNSSYASVGNLICLSGGVINGLAVNFIKKACVRNTPASVYLSACIFGLLFNSLAIQELSNIPPDIFVILIVIALLALVAQILLGYGFRYTSAAKGSIIGFFETQLTLVMSWVLVGEEINPKFLGGAIIILLGLLINQHSFSGTGDEKSEAATNQSQAALFEKIL